MSGGGGTSNALARRLRDPQFANRYFVGAGIDIGCGGDSLELQLDLWPKLTSVKSWDKGNGDAGTGDIAPARSYDLVYSSHCLEHIHSPEIVLLRWFKLVKPGGHLVVVVPDEQLYEQGVWPSTFNADHKHSFTTRAGTSTFPSGVSINVFDLLDQLCGFGESADVIKVERIEEGFDFAIGREDQTSRRNAESCVEFIVRKLP